jgi:hypothetical protein
MEHPNEHIAFGAICKTPIWPGDRVRLSFFNARLSGRCEIGVAHLEKAGGAIAWMEDADRFSSFVTLYQLTQYQLTSPRPNYLVGEYQVEIERVSSQCVVIYTSDQTQFFFLTTDETTMAEHVFVWLPDHSTCLLSIANVHSKNNI